MSGRQNYAYQPDYHESQGSQQRDNRGNKWGKRAKKAGKKLKKADKDGGGDAEITIETPPDGGLAGWSVAIGSAVLTSSNAVVRASLNEAVPSINADFNRPQSNVTTPTPPVGTPSPANYTVCYNGLQENFDLIFGEGARAAGHPAVECLNLGNPAFYDCMSSFATTSETPPPDLVQEFCPQLYQLFVQALGLTGDQGTALRLTAGNIQAPPVPTTVDDIGDVMNFSFVCISFVAMLIAAMLSVFVGYRVVSMVGSILIAVGFIVAAFLNEDQEILVQILVGGVAGIGSSFVRFSAIAAILEYFDELRMRAIVISGLGAVLVNFLVIGLTFVDGIDFHWRKTFKFQAIPAGISLVTSLVLKPLKRKSRRQSRGGNSCSRKCSEEIFSGELWKDIVLYLIIIVFFLDQLGRPIFSEGMQPIMEEKGFSGTKVDIQPLIENGGSFVGLLGLLVWKTHNLGANLAVMAVMDILIGLLALHVPEMTTFAWAAAYSAIFGFTEGVFNSVIQDAIPEGFRRHHIKMVAGILGFVAGVGTVVSTFVGDAIDERGDGSRVSYYFAGACLLTCAAFAVVSRVLVVRRRDREQANDNIEFDNIRNSRNQRY